MNDILTGPFIRKKKYKARDPYDTITIIRNILADCDIFVSENNSYFEEADISSCRIWIADEDVSFADFGTNGKGMTARYSLASAYGEFMERLQSMILFGDYAENAYRNSLTRYMCAPDEVMLSAGETLENCGDILSVLMRTDLKSAFRGTHLPEGRMPSVPFYDVVNDRTVLLPCKTLRMVTGSNGMAAGNTFKEAFIQGLSELYERAAVLEAYRDNPSIPLLRQELFKGNAVYDKLERLKMYGFDVKILDLSMGKGYPVTGLHLCAGGAKAFRAGADPCPVTALERCVTEMFQGSSREEVTRRFRRECLEPFPSMTDERRRMDANMAEISYHVDESGLIADCLYNPSDIYSRSFRGTFAESEKADLDYLADLTRELGWGLYVRDWSFLGFPACQILIPEASNYDLIYEKGADVFAWSFEELRFRNDRITEGCAARLNRLFEKYEDNIPLQDKSMDIK